MTCDFNGKRLNPIKDRFNDDKFNLTQTRSYNTVFSNQGGICMSGSIYYRKDRGIYVVGWYDKATKKKHTIYRYNNEFMYHQKIADKCLAAIQSDYEKFMRGEGSFRIEKYTGKG